MELMIWELFQVDMEHGKIITKRLSTDARLQMLNALALLHFKDDDLKSFQAALKGIGEFKDDRNFVAHGTWFRDKNGLAVATSTRPKVDPFTVIVETFTTDRFDRILQGIRKCNGELGRHLPSLSSFNPIP